MRYDYRMSSPLQQRNDIKFRHRVEAHSPGCNFLVKIEYWTSFASWIIISTSCCDFFPFLTSCWNSASTVYSPRKKALTRCSLIGKRALTDFSPVQSSRWVLRSTNIYMWARCVHMRLGLNIENELTVLTSVSPYHRKRTASAPSVFSKRPRYSSSSSLSK
jgi:hypothetical protein